MISCNKMDIAGMREEGNGNGPSMIAKYRYVYLCSCAS